MDHPIIRNMERTGYPDGKEPQFPVCPECGMECETVYTYPFSGKVLGCDKCISVTDAWEVEECFPEQEQL